MDPVKYGIVGFGGIAENRVAKEGFALDRCRFDGVDLPMILVAATDINPKRKENAAVLGLRWYDSYEQMLENPGIEAIYVATSNTTHFPIALQALKAGKHVIIEKPITTKVEDAQVLKDYAAEHNLSISVNLMMTKNVYNRKARDLIAQQAIGKVEYSNLHMEFLYGEDPQEAATWRCSAPEEIGGPIGDVGGHCLDLAEFLFNQKIVGVQCVYYPKTLNIVVESGAFITFRMENGLRGSVRVGFNQPRGGLFGTIDNLGFEVYGEKGILSGHGTVFQLSGHKDEPVAISLDLRTPEFVKSFTMTQVENIYQAHISEHALSIRNKKPLSGEHGLHNIALVLACHESARNGGKEVAV